MKVCFFWRFLDPPKRRLKSAILGLKNPFFRKIFEISKVRAWCVIGARQFIFNFYIVYLPCKTRRKGFMVIFSESMFFWRFLDPSQKTLEKCYFRPFFRKNMVFWGPNNIKNNIFSSGIITKPFRSVFYDGKALTK